MHLVPQIEATYRWMVEALNADIVDALEHRRYERAANLERYWRIQERGLFVLLFAQFETEVTAVFERARDERRANPDWRVRRGWDVPAYQTARVPFETKLAMVLDRQQPEFARICDAYRRRNHCAHGGMSEPIYPIDAFIRHLYHWQSLLRG
jgi:hypothetical protein